MAMGTLAKFQDQFRQLKVVEDGKDQLIENLLLQIKELEEELAEERLDFEREQETAKTYQIKFRETETELKRTNEKIDSNGFVSVLIDGDGMLFVDEFVKSTKQGGQEAARTLMAAVEKYVAAKFELPRHTRICIRIYANIRGLASAYCHNQILGNPDELYAFVRGFNMGHPLCDFVDAGDGKECADAKLKEIFSQDVADSQCKAVIFGGSADDGYARLLGRYGQQAAFAASIILGNASSHHNAQDATYICCNHF